MKEFNCHHCGNKHFKSTGHYNRAKKLGLNLFCSRTCAGKNKRSNKTVEQKKEEKRIYDKNYRALNYERLKPKKKAYFKKVYAENPEKFRLERKRKYKKHLEYLSTPEYKEWKKAYDRKYRCKQEFGEYWEAASLLLDLENEILKRATKYEIKLKNNTLNKALQRGRNGQVKRGYS